MAERVGAQPPVSRVVEHRRAADDQELGRRVTRPQLGKGFDDPQAVLARLEATDREDDWTSAESVRGPHGRVAGSGAGREGRGVDAVRDAPGRDAEEPPHVLAAPLADAEHGLGRRHAPLLARLDLRVGEVVEVVDGADETGDQPGRREVGERIAADAVMGVVEVETPVIGNREPLPVFGDALLDHVGDGPALDPQGRHRDGAAACRSIEPPAGSVGRMHDSLVAERGERLGER